MKKTLLLLLSAMIACASVAHADPVAITLTISFQDQAHADAAVTLLAAALGYQPTVNGAPNPETELAFCKRTIGENLASQVKNQAAIQAAKAAQAAAAASLNGVTVQ